MILPCQVNYVTQIIFIIVTFLFKQCPTKYFSSPGNELVTPLPKEMHLLVAYGVISFC
jgi:hypothetical protein